MYRITSSSTSLALNQTLTQSENGFRNEQRLNESSVLEADHHMLSLQWDSKGTLKKLALPFRILRVHAITLAIVLLHVYE